MRFSRTTPGRPMDERFHERRQEARLYVISETELSDIEQARWAMYEAGGPYPLGGLPSAENETTWHVEDPVSGKEYDVRDAHDTI